MPPPTSKAEKFRAPANACIEQAGNCSTEREKTHWLTLAEDWLKMARTNFHFALRAVLDELLGVILDLIGQGHGIRPLAN